jgi:hypothetical protein
MLSPAAREGDSSQLQLKNWAENVLQAMARKFLNRRVDSIGGRNTGSKSKSRNFKV